MKLKLSNIIKSPMSIFLLISFAIAIWLIPLVSQWVTFLPIDETINDAKASLQLNSGYQLQVEIGESSPVSLPFHYELTKTYKLEKDKQQNSHAKINYHGYCDTYSTNELISQKINATSELYENKHILYHNVQGAWYQTHVSSIKRTLIPFQTPEEVLDKLQTLVNHLYNKKDKNLSVVKYNDPETSDVVLDIRSKSNYELNYIQYTKDYYPKVYRTHLPNEW